MQVIPETKVLFLEVGQLGGILGNGQCKSPWKMWEEQCKDGKGPAMSPISHIGSRFIFSKPLFLSNNLPFLRFSSVLLLSSFSV